MSYEYEAETTAAANAILDAIDLAFDETPNSQQLLQFVNDAVMAFTSIQKPLSQEALGKFKAKVGIKVGLKVADGSLDRFIKDEPNV